MDTFAEPVVFFPKAGGTITTFGGGPNQGRGVFDRGYSPLEDLGGDTPTATDRPTLGIRLAEFSVEPVENDKVFVPSEDATFIVRLVRRDSHGGARLELQVTDAD